MIEDNEKNKYLALDRRIWNPQGIKNMKPVVSQPQKDRENGILFTEDKPWEVRIDNGYPNVIYDQKNNKYRCYYTLFIYDLDSCKVSKQESGFRDYIPRPDRIPALAYAESTDGVHWIKPNLNMVLWEDSKENNILIKYAHGTGVMLDENEKNEQKRYKMVTKIDIPQKETYMAVAFSKDGIHWSDLIPWPEHNPIADSHNFPFWNEKEHLYQLITRTWKDGIRVTVLSRSEDFIHWSEPVEIMRGIGYENQIYSMPIVPYQDIYLGFASFIHEGDRTDANFDTVDTELTWAVNTDHFDYVSFQSELIPRGKGVYPNGEADCGCIYISPPVEAANGDWWLYYMGGNGYHTNFRETSLLRAVWKKDHFACMMPKNIEKKGLLVTSQFAVTGNNLELDFDVIDENKPYFVEVSVHEKWTQEALKGFESSAIKETKKGTYQVLFMESLNQIQTESVCFKISVQNVKIWNIQGDIKICGHRLWEGAV